MTKDGVLMETENGGLTWTEDQLDTDGALLPRTALAYVSWTLDAMTDYALLVGNNPAVSDKAMTVWRKLADDDGDGRWVYMPLADDNPYYLPRMEHVALACFDGYVLAFGSDHKIYRSRDQGITWRTTSMYSYPADFTGTSCQVATDEDYLWLTDPATGQTWKGWLTK